MRKTRTVLCRGLQDSSKKGNTCPYQQPVAPTPFVKNYSGHGHGNDGANIDYGDVETAKRFIEPEVWWQQRGLLATRF